MPVANTSLTGDQGKYIADALIARSELIHKLPQFCEPTSLKEGMGKTANFVRYERTDIPLAPLTEGTTPAETPFSITTKSITVDQWGMYIALTDVAVVTTKHPVLNEALDLVADAIARVQDEEIARVLNAGTNVQYYDGSVATRGALTASNVFKTGVATKARTTLNDAGSPPRDGDLFVAVMGPQVESDIMTENTQTGGFTFGTAHVLQDTQKLERGVVGTWLGFKWVRTNFIPKFSLLSAPSAPTATTGGSLTSGSTYYWKWIQKNTQRGFREVIAAEQNASPGGSNTAFSFVAPASPASGVVYDLFFGTATGDANLFLASSNIAPGATVLITAAPTSGDNPGATPPSGVTVHPIYCFAFRAVDNVKLDGMSMMGMITPTGANDSDPLSQRRKMGSKYMSKAGIRDTNRLLRIELCSNY